MIIRALPAILFCFLFSGLAQAQTISINPTDQNGINQAISQAQPGDTVFLNAGVYEVTGTINVHSNLILTGSQDAIIRVSSSSSQFFTGSVGIISCNEPVDNVQISGFQIDGNCPNLPRSFANTEGHDHDCERGILLKGDSGRFCNNITISQMKIYDCFSDGIYIAWANNVYISKIEASNNQHETCCYLCEVMDAEVEGCHVAGITSDCIRVENSQRVKVHDNLLYSYSGDHNNGAYEHGENGIQAGNQGYSHGYGSPKPDSIKDIEIFNNTFANNGLQAILLDSMALAESTNIFIHDNKFLGSDELKTLGLPVELANGSYPTLQQSEQVFNSILDIMYAPVSDSGYVQQSNTFQPDKTLISKGTESAWIDVIGYTGQIKIGNNTYIPKPANECAIILIGTKSNKSRVINQDSSKKLSVEPENKLKVTLEVRTWYEVPEKQKISVWGKSINYTTFKKVSENTTFSKTFKAPSIFPAFNAPNVSVINYNGSHAIVFTSNLPGIVKIDYRYKNSTATEYRLIGFIGSATNGFKSNDYKVTENYLIDNSGILSESLDGLYIKDKNFDVSKLNVTVVTPYENFHISHFQYIVIENDYMKFFKWGLVGILGFFFIYGRAIYKIIFSVVGKWI